MDFVSDYYMVLGVAMFDNSKEQLFAMGRCSTGKMRKRPVQFSEEELRLIEQRFPHEETKELAKDMGRRPETINKVAQRMGVRKSKEFYARTGRKRRNGIKQKTKEEVRA